MKIPLYFFHSFQRLWSKQKQDSKIILKIMTYFLCKLMQNTFPTQEITGKYINTINNDCSSPTLFCMNSIMLFLIPIRKKNKI